MTEDDQRNDGRIDRRTYLQIAGGAAIVGGMAGCLGGANAQEVRYGYGGDPIVLESSAPLNATSVNLTAESEPNDACSNPNPIATDTEISGTLEPAGADWYSFDLSAGTTFDVVFDRVPTTGITGLVVYSPGCHFQELRQVGTDGQVRLTTTASEDGTYTVDTGSLSTPTPTPTTTPQDDYGEAGYGEAGYGGTA